MTNDQRRHEREHESRTPFKSRKNDVSMVDLDGQTAVLKRFADPAAAMRERAMMDRAAAAGLAVPALLPANAYEYVDAPTLAELLEQAEARLTAGKSTLESERGPLLDAWQALFKWLWNFHAATGLIMGDVNARNFLYGDGTLTGFDFEDAREGEIEEDVGRSLAFMMAYDPIESPLKQALWTELTAWLETAGGLSLPLVTAYYGDERAAMRERRSGDAPC